MYLRLTLLSWGKYRTQHDILVVFTVIDRRLRHSTIASTGAFGQKAMRRNLGGFCDGTWASKHNAYAKSAAPLA
jgi:hypothetical protein